MNRMQAGFTLALADSLKAEFDTNPFKFLKLNQDSFNLKYVSAFVTGWAFGRIKPFTIKQLDENFHPPVDFQAATFLETPDENIVETQITPKRRISVVMEKQSSGTDALCEVVFSFKALLLFIYKLINICVHKLSGPGSVNSIKLNHAGDNNNTKTRSRLKEIWEIPGPRSLPFFGTLFTSKAMKSADVLKANEERVKLYGPIVKEEHFWNYPLIMILGGDEIKKIVQANSTLRPGMDILMTYRSRRPDRYDSLGLVNSQGSTWKRLHSIFAPVTTNRKFVRSLHPVLHEIVTDISDSIVAKPGPTDMLPQLVNKLITEGEDLLNPYERLHMSIVSSIDSQVFGKRIGTIDSAKAIGSPEKWSLFTNCHDIYWKAFHKSMYGFPWWKYLPTKIWDDFTTAEDAMIKMIDETTDELLQSGTAGGVLAAVTKDEISRNDLNVVLLELITGATEPVYQTVIITLYWISKYEHVYNRILEELREQMPTKDSPVDETVLQNTSYIKACIMESFRICPTTCNVARILDKEMEIGGYKLPKFTTVILQSWHASLQDSSFYRAKEYLPERWLLENGVPPFRPHERQVMCNFGIGTRACPGRKIAEQLIQTFLCKVLRKFKVKFAKDIEVQYEFLLVVKDPIIVEFQELDT